MPRIVQARGLPCPQPVLLTKKAMQEADDILTIVDGPDQAENVARMARQAGWQVEVNGKEEAVYVRIIRPQRLSQEQKEEPRAAAGPLVLVVPGGTMGRGESTELGEILIRSFFHTLLEIERRPDVIVLYNSGVRLVVEGSPILEDLRTLSEQGVQILVCGTCLGHFDLKDRVAVGTISNMYTISETLLRAGRVVTL